MIFTGERFVPGIQNTELEFEHVNRYGFAQKLVTGLDVLDAACGTGYGTAMLAETARHVDGLDIAQEAVDFCRAHYASAKINFTVGSVSELPYADDSFDAVVSFETIEHVDSEAQEAFMREIKRVLRPQGILILSTPNILVYDEREKNSFHVHELNREELDLLLKRNFAHIIRFAQKNEVCNAIVPHDGSAVAAQNGLPVNEAEYFIDVCGDADLPTAAGSLMLRQDDYLHKTLKWAVHTSDLNETANAEVTRLGGEVEKLSHWGKALDQELNTARTELTRLNSELGRAQDESQTEIARLSAELARTQDESQAEIDRLSAELARTQNESQAEIDRLSAELARAQDESQAEIDRLSAELERAQGESQAEIDRLNAELARTQKDSQAEINRLNAGLQEIDHAIDNLSEFLQIKYTTHATELERLNAQIAADREACEALTSEVQHHKGHVEALERVVDECNDTIATQKAENERLDAVATEYELFKSSRAYRYAMRLRHLSERALPPNTRRRMLAHYTLKTVKHPLTTVRLMNTVKIRDFMRRVHLGKDACHITEAPKVARLQLLGAENIRANGEYVKLKFPAIKNPLVSIVIPVYNQFDYTYLCLKSILENTPEIAYEVILADDCSTDDTVRAKEIAKNIVVARTKENLRFLRNCNNAAKLARGKYIFFLNNDTQVQKDWLKSLLELIEADESIGMIGSKLIYASGELQEAGGIVWSDGSAWNFGRMQDANEPEYNYVKDVDYISGAAIMIRTSLWQEIGGFDDRLAPAYYEDTDLAYEVRKHGKRVVYDPKSVVVHFEGVSNGTDTSAGLKAYQVRNAKIFYEKWKDTLALGRPNGVDAFLMRDRSLGQKHILVVDHYVPEFDKDAGGKNTYLYLRLLKSMGLHVTFLGDNFYQSEPYTSILQQQGIEVLYGGHYMQTIMEWFRINGKYFDYVYLNRPHISEKYVEPVRKYTHARLIYFGQDLTFLRERRQYEVTGDAKLLESSRDWEKRERALFTQADVIFTAGTYEQKIVQEMVPAKPVFSLPLYPYEGCRDIAYVPQERKNIMFVAGFAHAPNIDAAKWFAADIFPLVKKAIPGIVCYIIGSHPTDEVKALADDQLIVTGFVTDEKLAEYYAGCRLSVVPLRYGAGIKGKVVDAAYNRIPLVTTTIGAEGLSTEEGCFAIEDDSQRMAQRIIELYNDPEQLRAMSAGCEKFIHNNLSEEAARKIWRSALGEEDAQPVKRESGKKSRPQQRKSK